MDSLSADRLPVDLNGRAKHTFKKGGGRERVEYLLNESTFGEHVTCWST